MSEFTLPFRIGEQVTGSFFTDRQEEVRRILEAMRTPTRMLVYGERRQGKSSAIRQAAVRAGDSGTLVLWADVSTAADLGEVGRRLISGVPFRWRWREELQLLLLQANLRVEARVDGAGRPVLSLAVGANPLPTSEAKDQLERVVRTLDDLAGRRGVSVALVLDEFQEVETLVPRGGWILRDLMQTTHHMSFVCAGSRLSLVDRLIAPDGPFHRFFEPLAIGPMDPGHLGPWMESRMEGAGLEVDPGVGAAILERAGPRTQDALQLARAVFLAGVVKGGVDVADVTVAFRRSVLEDGDRFETIWAGLADSHRRVLRAVAMGEVHLASQEVGARYGLPTTAAVSKAVRVLQERRHLGTGTPVRMDDPFFAEWILLRAMPDGGSWPEMPGGE